MGQRLSSAWRSAWRYNPILTMSYAKLHFHKKAKVASLVASGPTRIMAVQASTATVGLCRGKMQSVLLRPLTHGQQFRLPQKLMWIHCYSEPVRPVHPRMLCTPLVLSVPSVPVVFTGGLPSKQTLFLCLMPTILVVLPQTYHKMETINSRGALVGQSSQLEEHPIKDEAVLVARSWPVSCPSFQSWRSTGYPALGILKG